MGAVYDNSVMWAENERTISGVIHFNLKNNQRARSLGACNLAGGVDDPLNVTAQNLRGKFTSVDKSAIDVDRFVEAHPESA